MTEHKSLNQRIQAALRGRVFIITGAGLSADSGLQTFRGAGGLWRNYNPMDLATPEAFARDAKLVWEWYLWRRSEAIRAVPNAAHLAIAQLATQANECLVVTQNVDDLHERAHTPPDRLVHVHGDLFRNRCNQCEYSDREDLNRQHLPPGCPRCQAGLLRPGVVWFGEMLDPAVLLRVDDFIRSGKCDLALVIGTTAAFHYIVDWAMRAKSTTGILLEINPEETPISNFADAAYRQRAAEVLPGLIK
jgi:NAD-dependent deacetylase